MLALANHLRQDGIDAMIDQYAPNPPMGLPRWMERQIQAADFVLLVCTETYQRRVEGREEPDKGWGVVWESNLIYNLIYAADSDVQRLIPVLLRDMQPASIPLLLRGVAHYRVDTDAGYEDLYRHLTNQPGTPMPPVGQRRSLPPRQPQSYPASPAAKSDPTPPTSLEQHHRAQLIKQIRLDWIEGVLNQSPYKIARIELNLANKPDAIEHPLIAAVQVPDGVSTPISPGTPISKIFDEQGGALLILGAPGTGKTTLLLELCRDLLDRAESDEKQPIPVVFPLSSWVAQEQSLFSSWSSRRQPLTAWLIAELNERSYVPKRIAQEWIEREQILPLFDGLDELPEKRRAACIDAVNEFRHEHVFVGIAVCCRTAEYQRLGKKLRLRSAVEVERLTNRQITEYLRNVGDPPPGLKPFVDRPSVGGVQLDTPLLLWLATRSHSELQLSAALGGTDSFSKSLAGSEIEFYSCFISYSIKDQDFAERLYQDLGAKGVRCWFASHDLQGGRKVHEQIDEAIRLHDKVLLILSPSSMASEWVKTEISKARNRELREKVQVLFPLSLAPFESIRDWQYFDSDTGKDSAREIREYFIPDFSKWNDHNSYQVAFDRLLSDLRIANSSIPRNHVRNDLGRSAMPW